LQFICDRAREVPEELKCKSSQSSGSQFEEFKTSRKWLTISKKRNGIKSVVMHGGATNSDEEGA
jgi:hypothetical protein